MYTIIVADDEEEIRRGIIRKVNWEAIGFRVIGEAENGIEALELVEKMEPDLLLTDIRMPFLSGIEMARQIREIRPTVQIAFLSGFDDFSYAQKAIQYNIISYMLKPISSHELEKELQKIKKVIDKKFETFAVVNPLQVRLEKAEFMLPLLLEGGSINEVRDENGLLQNAVSCGLLENENAKLFHYVVIVTSLSAVILGANISVNAIDSILKKYVKFISCYVNDKIVSIVAATPGGLKKYLHIIVEEISQSVERIMGVSCNVGISRSTNSLSKCRECYLEAMNALSYSRQKEESIHFIADEERMEAVSQELMQDTVSSMENLLRGGSNEELDAFLSTFQKDISKGRYAPALAEFLTAQMISAMFRVVYTVAGDEYVQQMQEQFQLSNNNTVGQAMKSAEQCAKLCMAAKALIMEQRKKSVDILCDKTLQIIRTRYQETNLSVTEVSNEISVSPNYLSSVIKKTTGNTFIELLTLKRIEMAKELLLCTSKKIWEITEEVGYSDQHYFSFCFKKIAGVSPKQFRGTNA